MPYATHDILIYLFLMSASQELEARQSRDLIYLLFFLIFYDFIQNDIYWP